MYCGGAPEGLKCYQGVNGNNNYVAGSLVTPSLLTGDLITHSRLEIQLPQDVLLEKAFNFYIPIVLNSGSDGAEILTFIATASEISEILSDQGVY